MLPLSRSARGLVLLIMVGCAHPGYQIDTPPGFSSTQHRYQMERQRAQLAAAQPTMQAQPQLQSQVVTETQTGPVLQATNTQATAQ